LQPHWRSHEALLKQQVGAQMAEAQASDDDVPF
jgi:hypothetical protein